MTIRIEKNPTPNAFAVAWAKSLEQSVEGLGGRDRKITWAEAKAAIAAGTIPDQFADNVTNFFTRSGRAASGEGISAQQLVAAAQAYAQSAAENAAGPDGRLSPRDAEKLPAELRAEYAAMVDMPRPERGDSQLKG